MHSQNLEMHACRRACSLVARIHTTSRSHGLGPTRTWAVRTNAGPAVIRATGGGILSGEHTIATPTFDAKCVHVKMSESLNCNTRTARGRTKPASRATTLPPDATVAAVAASTRARAPRAHEQSGRTDAAEHADRRHEHTVPTRVTHPWWRPPRPPRCHRRRRRRQHTRARAARTISGH